MTSERRKTLIYVVGALLLVAAALLAIGLGVSRHNRGGDGVAATRAGDLADTAANPETTASAGSGSETSSARAADSGSTSNRLSPTQLAAIKAELSAIETALESMNMPGDSDFKDIETGLK